MINSTTPFRIYHFEDVASVAYFRRRSAGAIEASTAFEALEAFLESWPSPVKGGYYFVCPDDPRTTVGGSLMKVTVIEVDTYRIDHTSPFGRVISSRTSAPPLTRRWDAAIEGLREAAPLLVRMLADVGEDGPTEADLTELEEIVNVLKGESP